MSQDTNMKKQYIIIAIISLVVVALLIFVFLFSQSQNNDSPLEPAVGSIVLDTPQGAVGVPDFRQDSLELDESKVFVPYYDSNYTIQYDEASKAFEIIFTVSSLAEIHQIRPEAEQKLLGLLKVEKLQMCLLNIREIVPQSEALDLTPNNFPLSFCEGGDILPQETNDSSVNLR